LISDLGSERHAAEAFDVLLRSHFLEGVDRGFDNGDCVAGVKTFRNDVLDAGGFADGADRIMEIADGKIVGEMT